MLNPLNQNAFHSMLFNVTLGLYNYIGQKGSDI